MVCAPWFRTRLAYGIYLLILVGIGMMARRVILARRKQQQELRDARQNEEIKEAKPFSSLSITTDRVPPYSHHTLSSSQHTPLSNKQNKNNNCGQLRMFPSSVHSLACTHSIPSISHFPSSFIQDTKPSSTVSDDSASAVEHGILP